MITSHSVKYGCIFDGASEGHMGLNFDQIMVIELKSNVIFQHQYIFKWIICMQSLKWSCFHL